MALFRILERGAIVVSLVAVVVILAPARASSLDCSIETWGAAQDFNAPDNTGVRSFIYIKVGTAADVLLGGWISGVLWEGTNNTTNLSTWVEIGYTRGWKGSNILTWYWGDKRLGDTIPYEHRITTPSISVNTWHHLKIMYTGSNTWTVYIDGNQPNNGGGVSSPNPPDSNSFQAGLEATSQCSRMGSSSNPGISDNLKYSTNSGSTWSMQWPTSTTLYNPGAANSEWATPYQDLHYWL